MNFYTLFHKLKCLALISSCILACISCKGQTRQSYNFGFEQVDTSGLPAGWLSPRNKYHFRMQTDSAIRRQGKFSLAIEQIDSRDTVDYGTCTMMVPPPAQGKSLKLTGYIRTENISRGFAGLWMSINDEEGRSVESYNMYNRGITGTRDWQEYSIELKYDPARADMIFFGGLLAGNGKMWVDHLQLAIDGKPIAEVALKKRIENDPAAVAIIRQASTALSEKLNPGKTKLLANLGMLWGFLKYYHPAVAGGKYNWDLELFRILPDLMTHPDTEAYRTMEKWVDSLGAVPACPDCGKITRSKVKLKPDFGYLFQEHNLPSSLVKKLEHIRDHHKAPAEHYYVTEAKGAGNPVFQHEESYLRMYPDAAIRLLGLYRYWNIIQYYFPYRYLIKEDRNKMLTDLIPRFVNAGTRREYVLGCLELIARTRDTHANISTPDGTLDSIKGLLITPFQAKFVEGKLVVSGYYADVPGLKENLKIGDVIESIDDTAVNVLVKKFLPLTPASNYETQLSYLSSSQGFLLRNNLQTARLSVRRGRSLKKIEVKRIPLKTARTMIDWGNPEVRSGYKLINENIGYIYPGRLKDNDLAAIQDTFRNTKGLIIDLRCYPSLFIPFSYGSWLKAVSSPFVSFTGMSREMPGTVIYGPTISNGGLGGANGSKPAVNADHYKGKLVIIVDASTVSQAEYTTMAFSTVLGATVLGSRTAGADGNVSSITLPGGIKTMISGLGVYYPDSTETQQVGVKIGLHAEPTIKGIQQGRDELLERAVEWITANKKAE